MERKKSPHKRRIIMDHFDEAMLTFALREAMLALAVIESELVAQSTQSHLVEVIERRGDLVDVRFNWHTMYFRYKTVDPYYGTSFYTIDFSGDTPLIRRKTVVLKNDYIHHVVDVYHF